MPKIDNLLAILWMLKSGEKITAKQISEKLEMNIRTVYRYIDTLSTSGVPIISDTGHHGGYTLLNDFMEAPLFFDLEEKTSLYHAAIFAEEAGYYGGEALNRAISKLSKYSNQEQETRLNQQVTSLNVIGRINSHSTESYLKLLEEAITEEYSVEIQYHKWNENESNYRLIDPYKNIYWNNKWYVIGFCHLRNDIRSFRVERIEHLLLTENKFNSPDHFSAHDFFLKNLLPPIDDKEDIIPLVITGNRNTLNNVCKHWFLGNYLQEQTSNQAVFLLERDIIHTHVPYLLVPYGKSIQIIEPISLKQRFVEVLSELIEFHQV
ncbi:YafY family transcriptional regulator [Paenibacillus motobuensis]|uniref:helix-turn-helix transcriptional regulator n=1 Tax=Paenibacillus TaxID=44249 RepID=UPI00203B6232|nr:MULTISPECIES: YafY family protein [Paenibacillus]MCM3039910.1 YafY family transcriptional regulator [Paenibacillus lutimineralis]MCM3647014.1 YafY family transcriptional regulator [Paenibacillus motobuensis]